MWLLSVVEFGFLVVLFEVLGGGKVLFLFVCFGFCMCYFYCLQCEQYYLCEFFLVELILGMVCFGVVVILVEVGESLVMVYVGFELIFGVWFFGVDGVYSVVCRFIGVGFGGEIYEYVLLFVMMMEVFDEVFEDLLLVIYFWG